MPTCLNIKSKCVSVSIVLILKLESVGAAKMTSQWEVFQKKKKILRPKRGSIYKCLRIRFLCEQQPIYPKVWLKTELHKKKKNAVACTHFCLVVCTCIYFVVSIHLYFSINEKKLISLKLGLKNGLRLECVNLSLSEMKHDWHRIMFLMGLFLIGGTLVPSSGNIHNCTYFLHYCFHTHKKKKNE